MNEASWLRYDSFADVAWPSRRSDLLVCFEVRYSALDRSSKSCFYCLHHDDEFAPTLVHVQLKLMSVERTWVRLLCYALVDATAPKVGTVMQCCVSKELLYSNTPMFERPSILRPIH
jgi:hypothetical protein